MCGKKGVILIIKWLAGRNISTKVVLKTTMLYATSILWILGAWIQPSWRNIEEVLLPIVRDCIF